MLTGCIVSLYRELWQYDLSVLKLWNFTNQV